jgi:small basic protein
MAEPECRVLVSHAAWESFFKEFGCESDRAAAVLAAAWIDHLLQMKLAAVFAQGSREARDRLFGDHGPFATLSSKITAAFCAGWLDADVHHDLGIIRKIRNQFAHRIHGLTIDSGEIRPLVESLQVPHRQFYDWGELGCAATSDGMGIVFYTGVAPEDVGEPLVIPAGFVFRLAVSWTIAYLAANLGVGIIMADDARLNAHAGAEGEGEDDESTARK